MPVNPTYPGVYIEEIPSGVRTITGVATSITAFIGRALRGPTDTAVTINSYADFERIFGGLWADSSLGYAVRDFYLNGGGQAIIDRLFHPTFATQADRDKAFAAAQAVATAATGADAAAAKDAALAKAATYTTEPEKTAAATVAKAAEAAAALTGATAATVNAAATAAVGVAAPITKARLTVNTLNLEAAYEGAWGSQLRARIDYDTRPKPDGTADTDLFNLSVRDGNTGEIEILRNVSVVAGHTREVTNVLMNESRLVRTYGALPTARPAAHAEKPSDAELSTGKTIWDDNATATNSKVANDGKASNGVSLDSNDFIGSGKEGAKKGLYALEHADLFNILCLPPYNSDGNVDTGLISKAGIYCEKRRAMLLVDPPSNWND